MNLHTFIYGLATLANLIWFVVTMRIDNRIGAKIDALKDWMNDRYMSKAECQGCQRTWDVRMAEVERRLSVLEER